MEMIYFTVVAIVLYLASDRILNWIELRRGKRFEHRSLIFFVIILVLALTVFNLIQRYTPQPDQAAGSGQGEQAEQGNGPAGQPSPVTE